MTIEDPICLDVEGIKEITELFFITPWKRANKMMWANRNLFGKIICFPILFIGFFIHLLFIPLFVGSILLMAMLVGCATINELSKNDRDKKGYFK